MIKGEFRHKGQNIRFEAEVCKNQVNKNDKIIIHLPENSTWDDLTGHIVFRHDLKD